MHQDVEGHTGTGTRFEVCSQDIRSCQHRQHTFVVSFSHLLAIAFILRRLNALNIQRVSLQRYFVGTKHKR